MAIGERTMVARAAANGTPPNTFGPWGPAATPRTEQVAERLIRERCQATIVETLGDWEAAPSRPEELARVREIIGRHIAEYGRWAPQAEGGAWLLTDPAATARRIYDSLFGYGVLQPLMDDPEVEEVICNGPLRVYTLRPEKRWEKVVAFDGDRDLLQQLKRWTAWAGQRLDESQPYVEAELPDGSRLSASIPPLSPDFPTCNIRKFVLRAGSLADLVALGTLLEAAADFLDAAFRARVNVLISGGTASGKTTFLNALGNALTSPAERVVTIEETRELQLARSLPDCVALVARQANAEGRGRLTIRDLVRLALRRSPTRIIVGEVRGGEALDMLDAMNTGHDGSGCTIHANSPRQALSKLATYALRTEERVPRAAIDEIIADTIQLVVQLRREPLTGHRRVTHLFEVTGSREGGGIAGQDLWLLAPERGTLAWTGVRPRCLAQIRAAGLPYHLPRQEG